jgi:anti-sigma factor ChrR (cupin superfamily)
MHGKVGRIALAELFESRGEAGRDFERYAWEPFREGVSICRIYGNSKEGPSAALLKYEPGASLPPHRHVGYEHLIVLQGTQIDESGETHAGTLVVNPPGTTHRVRNEGPCVVLAIWERPVEFI